MPDDPIEPSDGITGQLGLPDELDYGFLDDVFGFVRPLPSIEHEGRPVFIKESPQILGPNAAHIRSREYTAPFWIKTPRRMRFFTTLSRRLRINFRQRAMVPRIAPKSTDALPLINPREPTKSPTVLKPTSKFPRKNADGQFEPPSSVGRFPTWAGSRCTVTTFLQVVHCVDPGLCAGRR